MEYQKLSESDDKNQVGDKKRVVTEVYMEPVVEIDKEARAKTFHSFNAEDEFNKQLVLWRRFLQLTIEETSNHIPKVSKSAKLESWVEMARALTMESIACKPPTASQVKSLELRTQKIAPVILAKNFGKSQNLKCEIIIKCHYRQPYELSLSSIDHRLISQSTESEHKLFKKGMNNLNGAGALSSGIGTFYDPEPVDNKPCEVHQAGKPKDEPNTHLLSEEQINKGVIENVQELMLNCRAEFDVLALDLASARTVIMNEFFAGVTEMYDIIAVDPNEGLIYNYKNADVTKPKVLGFIKKPMAAPMLHALIHEEGISCTRKSGRFMGGIIQGIKELKLDSNPNARVIILLPESFIR